MDAKDARRRVETRKQFVGMTHDLFGELFRDRIWEPLGYESWDLFAREELSDLAEQLSRKQRHEVVADMTKAGASTREIAAATGTDQKTAWRDQQPLRQNASDDQETKPEPDATPRQNASDATAELALDVPPKPEPEPEPVEIKPLEPLTPGWHQLGEHRLYCGDSTDQEFINACGGAAFAFADPPYNAGKAEWDQDFLWKHDYLADNAAIVAVTPGIVSLPGFFKISDMPYQWSIAAEITNGMTRGALGFGNWICVPVFAHGSIYRNSKDVLRIPASTGEDKSGSHPSRKPLRLLTALIELFTSKHDLVIDPFLGSGTTLIAAERTGRRCIGAEINPNYCAEIAARWKAA